MSVSSVASKLSYHRPKRFRLKDLRQKKGGGGGHGDSQAAAAIDIVRLHANDIDDLLPAMDASRVADADDDNLAFYDATEESFGSDEHTQAFSWVRHGTAYVAFRGTSSHQDMLTNLDVRRSEGHALEDADTTAVRIHNGFLRQFKAVEAPLIADLRRRSAEYSRIVFTGHSLGGALATIAATVIGTNDAEALGNPEIACITFGSPRVGNRAFGRAFARAVPLDLCCRVTHYEDPVPMVPLSPFYCHVPGTSLRIGSHADAYEYAVHDDVTALPRTERSLLLRVVLALASLHLTRPIAAHSMALYIRRLQDVRRGADPKAPDHVER